MREPTISIHFESHGDHFQPLELLVVSYRIDGFDPDRLTALETSVLWRSSGKGDEDLGIHFFDRKQEEENRPLPMRKPASYRTQLPHSPLSYDGVLVKILWSARVRAFFEDGKEIVQERRFLLGCVKAPTGVVSHESVQVFGY